MATLDIGSTLEGGKYRILGKLGAGGMGVVFKAEHTKTHRQVALKCLLPGLAATPEAVERLTREAMISARVRHPNVVDIYDVGREGELVFLVMELLHGETLGDAIDRGALQMPALIALLLPAMRGVAAAHREGIVHRDIKPDNIFLARVDGAEHLVPKVLDFGISKLMPQSPDELPLTRTGSMLGTPSYMSYEQLSGERDIDKRADVYSFGVILYKALTGQLPFQADSYSALIVKVATGVPAPLRQLRADIPRSLARLVLWAMARDRAQRIESLEQLIQELEPFTTAHGFNAELTQTGDASVDATLPALAHERVTPLSPSPRVPNAPETAAQPRRAWMWLSAVVIIAALVALLVGVARPAPALPVGLPVQIWRTKVDPPAVPDVAVGAAPPASAPTKPASETAPSAAAPAPAPAVSAPRPKLGRAGKTTAEDF